MKKSPLSTPGGGNFYRGRGGGRGRGRGYGYNNMRNDNDNFYRFSGSNNSPSEFNGDMIPLSSSSPKIGHGRGNWRQQNDRRDQRFSNTGVSGSYNTHRNSFQGSPDSPYSPQKFQYHNQQQGRFRQRKDNNQNKKLPITEVIDVRGIDRDPWKELENMLESSKKTNNVTVELNDSSVQIILERNGLGDSSSDSISDNGTINISSSCDDVKQSSSVDLPIDSISFSQDSSVLSASGTSQSETSVSETANQSQNDSVVEIVN